MSANRPDSRKMVEATSPGVPCDEEQLVLVGNAARICGFGR